MDQWVQWIATTIIAIIAIIVGRIWERNDHRLKKDKVLIDKILAIIPIGSDTYLFLKDDDFGSLFRRDSLRPLYALELLLSQPSNLFLNKKASHLTVSRTSTK